MKQLSGAMGRGFFWVALAIVGLGGCEKGLDPVNGFEGKIYLPTDSVTQQISWPDSLYGAVVVVAEFKYPLYTSIDSFFAHIVTYGDPLDTSRAEQDYFIQIRSGNYLAGVVGLKVPVTTVMFMPRDSLARHPEYFSAIGLYVSPGSLLPISTVGVFEDEITAGIDIRVDYNLQLPF